MKKPYLVSKISFGIIALLFICSLSNKAYAQNLTSSGVSLEVVARSDKPKTEPVHFYELQVSNTSSSSKTLQLTAMNTTCSDTSLRQAEVKVEVMGLKGEALDAITLAPGQKKDFKIKLSHTTKTQLHSFSCIEVFATSGAGKQSEEKIASVTLSQLNVDPSKIN